MTSKNNNLEAKVIKLLEKSKSEKPGLLQGEIQRKLNLKRDDVIRTLGILVREKKIGVMRIGKANLYFLRN